MAKQPNTPNTPNTPNAPVSSTPNAPAPGVNGQAGTDNKLSAVTATAADSENSEQTLGDANAGNAGNATQAVAAAQLATAEADRLRAENEDLRRKLTEATTTPRAAQAVAAAQGSLVVTAAGYPRFDASARVRPRGHRGSRQASLLRSHGRRVGSEVRRVHGRPLQDPAH
jgi:hypothetical protein